MFQCVVVPLDGSENSARALEPARTYARTHNLPIKLVRAVDPPLVTQVSSVGLQPVFLGTDAAFAEGDREAHEYIDALVDHLRADGMDASGVVVWGRAATAVADTIAPGDLIVMSSHGRTGASRWFVGSVAEDILKRTSNSVLLVREDG